MPDTLPRLHPATLRAPLTDLAYRLLDRLAPLGSGREMLLHEAAEMVDYALSRTAPTPEAAPLQDSVVCPDGRVVTAPISTVTVPGLNSAVCRFLETETGEPGTECSALRHWMDRTTHALEDHCASCGVVDDLRASLKKAEAEHDALQARVRELATIVRARPDAEPDVVVSQARSMREDHDRLQGMVIDLNERWQLAQTRVRELGARAEKSEADAAIYLNRAIRAESALEAVEARGKAAESEAWAECEKVRNRADAAEARARGSEAALAESLRHCAQVRDLVGALDWDGTIEIVEALIKGHASLSERLAYIDAAREGEPPMPDWIPGDPGTSGNLLMDWGRAGWAAAASLRVELADQRAVAIDNKDWFDALQTDLAAALGMPEGTPVSDLLARVKALRSQVADLTRERDGWERSAGEFCRNQTFYRDLLDKTASHLGPDVFVSDDGSVQDEPLRLKIPEMVADLTRRVEEADERYRPVVDALERISILPTKGSSRIALAALASLPTTENKE